MLNALTNAKNLALFLFAVANAYSNPLDSIPIAEYCVGYGKKVFCDLCFNCDDCDRICDSTDVHLRLKTNSQELPRIATCLSYSDSDSGHDSIWISKFLIHDDLKAERSNFFLLLAGTWIGVSGGTPGIIKGPNCDAKCEAEVDSILKVSKRLYSSGVYWHFAKEIPIYAKNGKQIDFNKYYEKNKIVPVEWELKASCGSLYDANYSGSYFVRITGECE